MPGLNGAKVGLLEARELMPKGREIYEATRDYLFDKPNKYDMTKSSRAIKILGQVVSGHATMNPPLPQEVVQTISDFIPQYHEPVGDKRSDQIFAEYSQMQDVAAQLLTVVFEYGYGNIVPISTE